MATYSVNLADWLAHKADFGLAVILQPVIPSRKLVEAERDRGDGLAVVLECDDERAEAIVKLVRKKYEKAELRFYRGRGKRI